MEREAADRVHEDRLAEGRPGRARPLQVDRRLHVDEGQRHELGEPARRALLIAEASRWRAQLPGPSTAPNMIVVVERKPTRCAASCTWSHWRS